jgi:hypothetical protein
MVEELLEPGVGAIELSLHAGKDGVDLAHAAVLCRVTVDPRITTCGFSRSRSIASLMLPSRWL